MHFLTYIIEGLSLLLTVNAFNYYPLDPVLQTYNQNQPYHEYNPYSLYQNMPTPLSPRYFLFGNLKSTFLPTFPRVQACMSIFLPDVHGSCLNLATCLLKGGKPVGKCNFGLKTCCMPFLGSSALPVTTFTSNSKSSNPTKFTIRRASPQFCQVRLDFKMFDVGETDPNGVCIGGLMITGELNRNGVPDIICGQNNGSHIYLNFDGNTPIVLMMVIDETLTSTTNTWSIKLTQIPCSDTTVPSECLQYYPESSGTVRSFNFRNVYSIDPSLTYQIQNMDYYVCIGPQTTTNTFNSITWSKGAGTTSYYFVVNGPARLIGPEAAGTIQAAAFGRQCSGDGIAGTEDYVEIIDGTFTGSTGTSTSATLYCGIGFPSAVTSTYKPFRIRVVTDRNEELATDVYENSVGFSLSYTLT